MPVCYLILFLNKKFSIIPLLLGVYGIFCFLFLFFFEAFPLDKIKYYQTFYTTFEYLIFSTILYFNIRSQKTKKIIVFFSLLFIVFQVIYVSSYKILRLDTIPIGIETILIASYIISFLLELLKDSRTQFSKHYCFWINIGILIYLCGSFFFYILIDSLSREEVLAFGKMTYIVEIIKNVLFGISLIIFSKAGFKKEVHEEIRPAPYLDIT